MTCLEAKTVEDRGRGHEAIALRERVVETLELHEQESVSGVSGVWYGGDSVPVPAVFQLKTTAVPYCESDATVTCL